MSKLKCWIEATRLRTLPVSVAGVITGGAMGLFFGCFKWAPVIICLLFAILAQIASNYANEYFDYLDGLDKKGRVGPRRGVTEGDITPTAMRNATIGTLALAAIVGCTLLLWGGWWLILAGIGIILGALAYSAGPYPLSRHALGEVAVVFFFGIVPVTLTYYLQSGNCPAEVWMASVAMGLLGANVLIVNNYRDIADDASVGKTTLAVKFGGKAVMALYLANILLAPVLTLPVWMPILATAPWLAILPVAWLLTAVKTWHTISHTTGAALNPMLGKTAKTMLLYTLILLLCIIIH